MINSAPIILGGYDGDVDQACAFVVIIPNADTARQAHELAQAIPDYPADAWGKILVAVHAPVPVPPEFLSRVFRGTDAAEICQSLVRPVGEPRNDGTQEVSIGKLASDHEDLPGWHGQQHTH